MGALHFGEIEFANRFFDMAAIHRSVSNQRFVTDRKVADCLRGELIEFQFFLLELGKEVMMEIVAEVRHDRSCPGTRFPENWAMSASFCLVS